MCGDHRPRFNAKFGGCSLPRRFVWGGLSFMNGCAMRAWFAGDAAFPGRHYGSGGGVIWRPGQQA
jgi:hypothetical protein